MGESLISISIIDSMTDLPPTEETNEVEITITSTVNQVTQMTKAFATIIPDEEEYDVDFSEYAIFATSYIEIEDVASVQLWHASPLSLQSNPLRLGTLSTVPLSVEIDSPTQHSTLELHTLSNASSMTTTATVDHHAFDGVPTLPAPPPPPSDSTPLALTNNHTSKSFSNWTQKFAFGNSKKDSPKNQNTIIEGGTYEIEELEIGVGKTINIQGDVILNVQGDLSLHGTKIILDDNATLTMHIGGDVEISSSSIGHDKFSPQSWMDPSRVQLYGHGDNSWEIDGLTTLKAEIYAPMSEVSFEGTATLCGRIAAEEVSFQGASRLLYDATLDNGGYADHESPLYDDNGELYSELANITELDRDLINSILESLEDQPYGSVSDQWDDWRNEPTARPNDVLFILMMYGADTQRWEQLVREAHREHGSMLVDRTLQ